jgi:hypothetical protein
MKPPVVRRLLLHGHCARLLAVLISWSADVSWRGTACLRGRFAAGKTAGFGLADRLQRETLKLNAHLLKFQSAHRPEERRSFAEGTERPKA